MERLVTHQRDYSEWVAKLRDRPHLCDVVFLAKDPDTAAEVPAVKALVSLGSDVRSLFSCILNY
jgi:hypothetical protein